MQEPPLELFSPEGSGGSPDAGAHPGAVSASRGRGRRCRSGAAHPPLAGAQVPSSGTATLRGAGSEHAVFA